MGLLPGASETIKPLGSFVLVHQSLVYALELDVFVKGGDYADAADWPEAEVVARQGGKALTFPFRAGQWSANLILIPHILDRYR